MDHQILVVFLVRLEDLEEEMLPLHLEENLEVQKEETETLLTTIMGTEIEDFEIWTSNIGLLVNLVTSREGVSLMISEEILTVGVAHLNGKIEI